MTEQPGLFDHRGRVPYGGHPPAQRTSRTSVAAAERAERFYLTQRGRVYRHISGLAGFGATMYEIASALDMRIQSVCPRINELENIGAVRKTGQLRQTESGASAEVYESVTGIDASLAPARSTERTMAAWRREATALRSAIEAILGEPMLAFHLTGFPTIEAKVTQALRQGSTDGGFS